MEKLVVSSVYCLSGLLSALILVKSGVPLVGIALAVVFYGALPVLLAEVFATLGPRPVGLFFVYIAAMVWLVKAAVDDPRKMMAIGGAHGAVFALLLVKV